MDAIREAYLTDSFNPILKRVGNKLYDVGEETYNTVSHELDYNQFPRRLRKGFWSAYNAYGLTKAISRFGYQLPQALAYINGDPLPVDPNIPLFRQFGDRRLRDLGADLRGIWKYAGSHIRDMAKYGRRLLKMRRRGGRGFAFRSRRIGKTRFSRRKMRRPMFRRRGGYRGKRFRRFGRAKGAKTFLSLAKAGVLQKAIISHNEGHQVTNTGAGAGIKCGWYATPCGIGQGDTAEMYSYVTNAAATSFNANTANSGMFLGGKAMWSLRNANDNCVYVTKYTCVPRTDIPLQFLDNASAAQSFPVITGDNPQLLIDGFTNNNLASQFSNRILYTDINATPYMSFHWTKYFKIKKQKTYKIDSGKDVTWSIKIRPKKLPSAAYTGVNAGYRAFQHEKWMGPIYLFKFVGCVAHDTTTPANVCRSGYVVDTLKQMTYKIGIVKSSNIRETGLSSYTGITNAAATTTFWSKPVPAAETI